MAETPRKNAVLIQVGKVVSDSKFDQANRVYSECGKSPTLPTGTGGRLTPKIAVDEEHWRLLTPVECERLQTLPDGYSEGVWGYTKAGKERKISTTQRYKMLGNAWTVDVIVHIFKHMEEA